MKHFIRIFLCCAVLLCGCTNEPSFVTEVPEGYLELVRAYRDGAGFDNAQIQSQSTLLVFSDRQIVLREVEVHDCNATNRPPISYSEGEGWVVQGVQTHIPDTRGKSAEESFPVYVYLFENTLHIYASNAELLRFQTVDEVLNAPEIFTVPKVYVYHDKSQQIEKDYAIDGTIIIEDPDCHYSDVERLEAEASLQGRGNSTWGMPKKPFKFKFKEKTPVLGMPQRKGWECLANYADKSLLRNALAMRISEILEMSWTPRYRIVELWLNDSYQGVYNVFEKKEVSSQKVDIDLDAGDCYLEIEQNIDEEYYFYTSRCGVPLQFKEPEAPTPEQYSQVKDLFNAFENALWSSDFKDPAKGYAAYIDVDSFVNNYIIRELAKDVDGNIRKSSFLTVEKKDGKIHFYHVWDFDLAFGNANYFPQGIDGAGSDPNGPYGWWVKDYNTNSYKGNGWYDRLFQDPVFLAKVQDRWSEVYDQLKQMPAYVDKLVQEMGDAPDRNFKTWRILGTYVWPNVKVTGSYEGEIEWLTEFYTERLEWLDKNLYLL
ncbi:MAG: CotH kinase family protein [Candidatus Cryptobacteroides sp.]